MNSLQARGKKKTECYTEGFCEVFFCVLESVLYDSLLTNAVQDDLGLQNKELVLALVSITFSFTFSLDVIIVQQTM